MGRRASKLLSLETYDPAGFLDWLHFRLGTKSDAKLAARLGSSGAEVSRIRARIRPITARILLAAHEETGETIHNLRGIMGDHQPGFFEPGLRFSTRSDEKSC